MNLYEVIAGWFFQTHPQIKLEDLAHITLTVKDFTRDPATGAYLFQGNTLAQTHAQVKEEAQKGKKNGKAKKKAVKKAVKRKTK